MPVGTPPAAPPCGSLAGWELCGIGPFWVHSFHARKIELFPSLLPSHTVPDPKTCLPKKGQEGVFHFFNHFGLICTKVLKNIQIVH